MSWNSLNKLMYFNILAWGSVLDILISLGFSFFSILHSFIFDLRGSILGLLMTSLEPKRSSSGPKPFGIKLPLSSKTSDSSLINSSISTVSNCFISSLVNLVGSLLFTSFTSISLFMV